jgi:hypothetical protein
MPLAGVTRIDAAPLGRPVHSGAIRPMCRGIAVARFSRMKHLLLSFHVVALGSLGVGAQAVPDFSGTWTMDHTRSEAAAQGTPIGPVTLAIRQTPDEVVVETARDGRTDAVRYIPAGSKTTPAGNQTGTFRWDGTRLITYLVTHINNQAVTVEETRSLNSGATEMLVEVSLVVQHGYQTGGTSLVRPANAPNTSTGKNVFVKAQ